MKRYTDKNTINQYIKHEAKQVFDDSTVCTRMMERQDKQRRKKFLLKLTNDNKYWWLSLSDDNKVSIIRYYTALPIIDIKKMYPANVAVVRELKLKELKI